MAILVEDAGKELRPDDYAEICKSEQVVSLCGAQQLLKRSPVHRTSELRIIEAAVASPCRDEERQDKSSALKFHRTD